jgi:hypothetical protein
VVLSFFVKLTTADVHLKPDPNALPGMPTGQKLANGLAYGVTLCFLVAALVGLGQWAFHSHHNSPGGAQSGRKRFGICLLCAFAVGALPTLINFAVESGGTVHK